HSTISSIVRSLEAKEFVGHKAYGRTYEYFPLVSREEYSRTRLRKLATDYFDGSMKNLVSFLVKDKELSIRELSEMLELLQKGDQQKGK
ncbi:MAG: BlaI/MecI/CopY family transcriptional regulator, partial [Saprospiraceae bacterium]|nr:BlaI/MecI/CopY family transcriptional regulator [Saprospiraceae bacterium]